MWFAGLSCLLILVLSLLWVGGFRCLFTLFGCVW